MKAYKGIRGIVPLINGDSRWSQGVSLRPRPLYTRGKSPPVNLVGPRAGLDVMVKR
jgi:hypothetical protein